MNLAHTVAKQYPPHGRVLIPYGDDLYFSDPTEPYKLILDTEEVMTLINANTSRHGVSIRWASPSEYFSELKTMSTFRRYTGDFLPYMTKGAFAQYWTGLYSLQPAFKRKIFQLAEVMRFAEILSAAVLDQDMLHTQANLLSHAEVLAGLNSPIVLQIYQEAVDHVTEKALSVIQSALKLMLNETESEAFPAHTQPVLLYNALNWQRTALYRFESDTPFVEIIDTAGKSVVSQAVPSPVSLNYTVYFVTELPALSVSVYGIVKHQNSCDACAHLSAAEDGLKLSGKEYRLEFDKSGLLKTLHHPSFGTANFTQSLYAVRSSIIDPYILAPGAIPHDRSLSKIPLTLLHFHLFRGPLLLSAHSTWTYHNLTFSQVLLITKEPEGLHWEITGFPMESDDLFVGFNSEMAVGAVPLFTFDGKMWRQRKYEKPGMGFEIGRNFYPIAGAVGLGKELVFTPNQPLSVGVHEGTFLFHLQRGAIHGEVDPFRHHFLITAHARGSLWRRIYHEAKQFNPIFPLCSSLQWPEAGDFPVEGEWKRGTSSWLGLDSGEFYLSSLVKKGNRTVIRVESFSEDAIPVSWNGMEIDTEMYAVGYQPLDSADTSIDLPVLCFKDCNQGAPVAFPGGNVQTTKTPFQTYSAYVISPLYHNLTTSDSIFDEETSATATDTSQVVEEDIPAEAPKEEIAVYDPPPRVEVQEEEEEKELEVGKEKEITGEFLAVEMGASQADVEVLEYCVVVSLGVIAVLSLGLYFRRRKRRRD